MAPTTTHHQTSYLSIKMIRKADGYTITVEHQDCRGHLFARHETDPSRFEASNGVGIQSVTLPEWRSKGAVALTLFVRGTNTTHDRISLEVNLEDGGKIMNAVQEYNAKYWGIKGTGNWYMVGKRPPPAVTVKTAKDGILEELLHMPMTEILADYSKMPWYDDWHTRYGEMYPKDSYVDQLPWIAKESPEEYKKRITGDFEPPITLAPPGEEDTKEMKKRKQEFIDRRYFCIKTEAKNISGLVRVYVTHMSHFDKKFTPQGRVFSASNGVVISADAKELAFHKGISLLNLHIYNSHKKMVTGAHNYLVVNGADAQRIKNAVVEYNDMYGHGKGTYCIEGKLPFIMDLGEKRAEAETAVKEAIIPSVPDPVRHRTDIERLTEDIDTLRDTISLKFEEAKWPPVIAPGLGLTFRPDTDSPKEDEMDEETIPVAAKRIGPLGSLWAGLKNMGAVAAVVAIIGGGIMGLNAWNASSALDAKVKCTKTVFEGTVKDAFIGNPASQRAQYRYESGPLFTMTFEDGQPIPANGCQGRTCEAGHFHPVVAPKVEETKIEDGSDF